MEANPFGPAYDVRPNRGPGLDPLQGSAEASVVGGVGRDLRYLATGGLAEERSGGDRARSATQAGYSELATSLYLQYCFAAGTPLLTPHGAKAIEELQVGDLVLSRDEHDATGPVEAKVIEEVFRRFGQVMWLTVAGQRIGTTSEHPFWVVGKGWLPAGDLCAGDRLVGIDGQTVCVEAKEPGEWQAVYNLRIADHHTYFVGCDEWGFSVWAHNAGYGINAATEAKDLGVAQLIRELEKHGVIVKCNPSACGSCGWR